MTPVVMPGCGSSSAMRLGAGLGAVGDEERGGALLDEVAGGELGHLAGADEEDGLAASEPKILRARSTATEAMETE